MAEGSAAPGQGTPDLSPVLWEEAGWLECELSVELLVHGFTVRELLQLSVGSVVETQWKNGNDMPLHANRRQIGWVEFEALGESLAVHLTELL